MRFKKILLIYPSYPGSHYNKGKNALPAIGLGIISEILTRSGVDNEVVDLGLGYEQQFLHNRISNYQPDALGLSMMTFKYKHIYAILEQLKAAFPEIPIIVGGPHITAWTTKVLEQCSAIDFGIPLEGEHTIQELCRGEALPQIKGLIYRDGTEIIYTGERELIRNLDDIPFPRYEKFELGKYDRHVQIFSSRGCPYKCIFCQSCSVLGKSWRSRSAQHVAEEMQYWYDRGYRNFIFADDNFTMNKKRIYRLCDEVEERFNQDVHLSAGGVRVDLVDKALLSRMRDVGFYYLGFGIEAGNDKILKALKKGFKISEAEQTVKDATELGYAVKLYFLVGSPYETLDDIQDSIEFARKYPVSGVNFGSLMPIPETELMDWVQSEGKLLAPVDVYLNDYAEFERIPHFDGPGMDLAERKKALELTEKVGQEIEKRYKRFIIERRFKKFGVLSKVIAFAGSSKLATSLLSSRAFKPVRMLLKNIIFKQTQSHN